MKPTKQSPAAARKADSEVAEFKHFARKECLASPDKAGVREITPESQPVFPCWLWNHMQYKNGLWEHIGWLHVKHDYKAHPDHYTHWHPDQPTPPTVTPFLPSPQPAPVGEGTSHAELKAYWLGAIPEGLSASGRDQVATQVATMALDLSDLRTRLAAAQSELGEVAASASEWMGIAQRRADELVDLRHQLEEARNALGKASATLTNASRAFSNSGNDLMAENCANRAAECAQARTPRKEGEAPTSDGFGDDDFRSFDNDEGAK